MRALPAAARTGDKQWYKPGVDYTVADFQRDRAACEKKGELDEECLKQRGWTPLSADKDKSGPAAPVSPRGSTGSGISVGAAARLAAPAPAISLRAVIFDFGGVLWDMRWDVAHDLDRAHGLPRSSVFETLYRTEAWRDVERGVGDHAEWVEAAHRELERRAGRPLPRLHEEWRRAQAAIAPNLELVRALPPALQAARC